MAENQPPTSPRDARAQAKADKAYQKAQRPWYKKKRFLIPLILIALLLIFWLLTSLGGGGGGGGNNDTGDPYSEPSVSEDTGGTTQTSEPSETAGAFPGATENDVVGQPGSPVTLGDMTVTSTPLVAADVFGQPYLCSAVTLTNGTDETVDYSVSDWQLQNPAGAIVNSTFGGSDTPLPSGQLVPGGTTTGDVCFNNDSGATGQYVVLYKPLTAFSSDRAAWVNTL